MSLDDDDFAVCMACNSENTEILALDAYRCLDCGYEGGEGYAAYQYRKRRLSELHQLDVLDEDEQYLQAHQNLVQGRDLLFQCLAIMSDAGEMLDQESAQAKAAEAALKVARVLTTPGIDLMTGDSSGSLFGIDEALAIPQKVHPVVVRASRYATAAADALQTALYLLREHAEGDLDVDLTPDFEDLVWDPNLGVVQQDRSDIKDKKLLLDDVEDILKDEYWDALQTEQE